MNITAAEIFQRGMKALATAGLIAVAAAAVSVAIVYLTGVWGSNLYGLAT